MAITMNQASYIEDMLNMEDDVVEESEVAEFFNNRNILITGGAGFLGTLLINKLLTSCPKLGKILLLLRAKKGKTPSERLQQLFDSPVFEKLRRDQPDCIKKCILIEGDTGKKDLGLSPADRDFIIKNTDIVIHGAAQVQLVDNLRLHITVNVKGTKQMIELARTMPTLKAFVHISTAYSHIDQEYIAEKFYESPFEVNKAIALIETLDDDELKLLTPKLKGKYQKTYMLSKALSEEVVRVHGTGLPVCIIRPPMIASTMYEPLEGWLDNFYGANGLIYIVGHMGIFRTGLLDKSIIVHLIPADYVVNNIIVAAWDINKQAEANFGCNKALNDPGSLASDARSNEPIIYNCVPSSENPITAANCFKLMKTYCAEFPCSNAVWYFVFLPTTNKWLHYVYTLFLHLIPSILIDTVARFAGQKPELYKKMKKIEQFYSSISFVTLFEWRFDNRNVTSLWNRINSTDKKLFYFDMRSISWRAFFKIYIKGIRQYLAKEPMSNLEASIARYRRLKLAHYTMVGTFTLILSWILISSTKMLFNTFFS